MCIEKGSGETNPTVRRIRSNPPQKIVGKHNENEGVVVHARCEMQRYAERSLGPPMRLGMRLIDMAGWIGKEGEQTSLYRDLLWELEEFIWE